MKRAEKLKQAMKDKKDAVLEQEKETAKSGTYRFLPGAIALVQEAIKLDKEEKYQEALEKYLESFKPFMLALKCT